MDLELALKNACKKENLEEAEEYLESQGFSFFGIESVELQDRILNYLNAGDTYDETICQENNGKLFVSSWGDWIEEAEKEYNEEHDTIRCGYCGHFTPYDKELYDTWNDVVCENCSHKVGGD